MKTYVPKLNGVPATVLALEVADSGKELECDVDCPPECIHFRINNSAEALINIRKLRARRKTYFAAKPRDFVKKDIMTKVAVEASASFGTEVSLSQVDKSIREFPNGFE